MKNYNKLPESIKIMIDLWFKEVDSVYLFLLDNSYHVKPLLTAAEVTAPSFKMIDMITKEEYYEITGND